MSQEKMEFTFAGAVAAIEAESTGIENAFFDYLNDRSLEDIDLNELEGEDGKDLLHAAAEYGNSRVFDWLMINGMKPTELETDNPSLKEQVERINKPFREMLDKWDLENPPKVKVATHSMELSKLLEGEDSKSFDKAKEAAKLIDKIPTYRLGDRLYTESKSPNGNSVYKIDLEKLKEQKLDGDMFFTRMKDGKPVRGDDGELISDLLVFKDGVLVGGHTFDIPGTESSIHPDDLKVALDRKREIEKRQLKEQPLEPLGEGPIQPVQFTDEPELNAAKPSPVQGGKPPVQTPEAPKPLAAHNADLGLDSEELRRARSESTARSSSTLPKPKPEGKENEPEVQGADALEKKKRKARVLSPAKMQRSLSEGDLSRSGSSTMKYPSGQAKVKKQQTKYKRSNGASSVEVDRF